MGIKSKTIFPNKTAEYFYKISYISFIFGMPNFWIEDLHMPKAFAKSYDFLSKLWNKTFYVLIPFELGAFVTQHNLTSKQESDRWIYSISHPILLAYMVIISRQDREIKDWMSHVLELKKVYNDTTVEHQISMSHAHAKNVDLFTWIRNPQMVRKSTLTSSALVLSCVLSMLLHSASACLQVIRSEGTFTTLITAWPLVDERSSGADSVRILTNIVWWVFVSRICASYIIVISLTTCMSFQYANLQSYFRSLDGIFQEDLAQTQMERKYEAALKTGIQLHSDTSKCINRTTNICGGVYSGQIVFVITMLVFLMSQMLRSERTMVNAFATAFTATAVLISTGFFLWNAGDITVEASNLATAMYSSGWHNCRGCRSERVRKLLVIAMSRAQKPVVLKGLGIMDLSYQSYLYLVKTSYSVFSVLY